MAPPRPTEREPPAEQAHLQRALRAAAARARTARIRADRNAGEAAVEARPQPAASVDPASAQRAPPAPDGGRQRFARTVAVAREMRLAGATQWPDEPWHLRVRDDLQAAPRGGWLERLLGPLRAGAQASRAGAAAPPETAGRPAMVMYPPATAAPGPWPEPAGGPAARAVASPAGSAPAALRLPPLRVSQVDAQNRGIAAPSRAGGRPSIKPGARRAPAWRPDLAAPAVRYRRSLPAAAAAPLRRWRRPG